MFSARNYFENAMSLSLETLIFDVFWFFFKMFITCVSLIKDFINMTL